MSKTTYFLVVFFLSLMMIASGCILSDSEANKKPKGDAACPQRSFGSSMASLQIRNWTIRDRGLAVTLENQGRGETISVTEIGLGSMTAEPNLTLEFGEESKLDISGDHNIPRGCYRENITITYKEGPITGKELSATLQGYYQGQ